MFSANRPNAGAPRAHELWMATFAYQGHEDQTLGLAAASAPTMGGCDMAQRTQTRPRAHRAWGSGSTSGGEFSLKLCFFELSFKSLRRELASSNTLADRILRPIRVVYESVCIRDVRDRRQMTGRTPIRRNRKKLGTGNPRGGQTRKMSKFPREVRSFSSFGQCTSRGAHSCALCTCTAPSPCSRAHRTHVTSRQNPTVHPNQTTRDF